jgi:hypothetical protein
MILNGTRPANHQRLPAAGDCADQPRNRVFERHRTGPRRAAHPVHESVTTAQTFYLQADMALKQQALNRTTPPASIPGRYKPPDQLLAFLEAL